MLSPDERREAAIEAARKEIASTHGIRMGRKWAQALVAAYDAALRGEAEGRTMKDLPWAVEDAARSLDQAADQLRDGHPVGHAFNAGNAATRLRAVALHPSELKHPSPGEREPETARDSLFDFRREALVALKDLVEPLEALPQSDRFLRLIENALESKGAG